MQLRTLDLETKNDPSIAELGEQLDAFVASIQARLQDIADMDMPRVASQASEQTGNQCDPLDRSTVANQRFDEQMDFCNGT